MNSGGLTGTLTFLFTDIEGSTSLWERQRSDMPAALARHDEIVRSAIVDHAGTVFATGGDGFAAVFTRAGDAVRAALRAQRSLSVEDWPSNTQLRVRMGLHSGEAHERDGDFFGPTVNRAARVMSAASGGQVLVSSATAGIADLDSDLQLADLGAVVLKGIDQPIVLHELVADGLTVVGRVVASGAKGNLPSQVNEFVGDIAGLLRRLGLADVRLVTLTGPGGVGKTRLACEVGGLVSSHYPDGVWLVELATVLDSAEVIATAASTLRVIPEAGVSTEEALRSWFSGRRMMLIIDNCEHVLAGAACLAALGIAACPTMTMIATSREPLGIGGEVVRSVASLDPAGDASMLFADRARAVNEHFRLDDSTAADVAAICSRLDGIPLAIELAAARARSLAPAEILQRLTDRFRLLRSSGRDGMERQHTLRATVTWSYQLLTTDEQLLFERLSVFAGGFDLAATEAACADARLDEMDLIDLLGNLVDKSMVVAEQLRGTTRYRMLETLRQFAEERLDASGETAVLRDRHLALLLHETPIHAACLCSAAQGVEHRWFTDRWDNIRAAFQWAIASADHASAASLLRAVRWHAFVKGLWETELWAEQLATASPGTGDGAVGHALLSAWATVRFDPAAARRHAQRTLESATDDASLQATAWFNIAFAHLVAGDVAECHAAAASSLQLALNGDEHFPEMWALQAALFGQTEPAVVAEALANFQEFAQRTECPTALAFASVMRATFGGIPDDVKLLDELLRDADRAAALLESIEGDTVVGALLTLSQLNLITSRDARADAPHIAALLERLEENTNRSSLPGALECVTRWLLVVEPSPAAATLAGFAAAHLPNWLLHEDWQRSVANRAAEIEGWERLSAAGSALALEGAVALALDELERVAGEDSRSH